MRKSNVLLVILGIAGTAFAQDLGTSRELPVKNTPVVTYEPPAIPKQGGDTFFDATVIPGLPFNISGDTFGYVDDYDEVCPYTGSVSPDVVYSYTPTHSRVISVDLCGSSYDTKTYIYDSNMSVVACNDDFYYDEICGIYVSKIQDAYLLEGETYYIVIDGYGGQFGAYELYIEGFSGCYLECYNDEVDEGEPPLGDGYVDAFNGGCNSEEFGSPFQEINWTNDTDGFPPYDGYAWLCGTTGWYLNPEGGNSRDTDWFRVYALQTGMMEFTVESEFPCYMFKLAPLDCGTVAVELEAIADCMLPATLSFPVIAGEEIWLWVGPTVFTGWINEFTYIMSVSNNVFDVVPSENLSWGGVKSLYR